MSLDPLRWTLRSFDYMMMELVIPDDVSLSGTPLVLPRLEPPGRAEAYAELLIAYRARRRKNA